MSADREQIIGKLQLPGFTVVLMPEERRCILAALRLADAATPLSDVLLRNGFVECDIPACNCGSWHARYGLPERIRELRDDLEAAGHPLTNNNGNLIRNALGELISERNALRALADAAEQQEAVAWLDTNTNECIANYVKMRKPDMWREYAIPLVPKLSGAADEG